MRYDLRKGARFERRETVEGPDGPVTTVRRLTVYRDGAIGERVGRVVEKEVEGVGVATSIEWIGPDRYSEFGNWRRGGFRAFSSSPVGLAIVAAGFAFVAAGSR